MIGKRVHMLVVVEKLPSSKVLCKCDCGAMRTVQLGHFKTGGVKSCGCHVVRHGHASPGKHTREYTSYNNMIARCEKKSNKRYHDYGGRNIKVCSKWKGSFINFFSDMGTCPEGFTLERKDSRKGYSSDNCKWASRKENQRNRLCSRFYTVKGKKYDTLEDAGDANNVSGATIRAWCLGRTVGDKFYSPKPNCSATNKY